LDADLIASLLLYGQEGPVAEVPEAQSEDVFVLNEDNVARAATIRKGPWFTCLSAYTAPIPNSRWIQDRQNFVSVYHDEVGLILGGGNTKLQPGWSTFTVGDTGLLEHTPGDASPDFRPKGELYHVPSEATLVIDPEPGLDLTYGPESCSIRVRPKDERVLELSVQGTSNSDLPVAAHLTLIPHLNEPLETAAGTSALLTAAPLLLPPEQLGAWVSHHGCRLYLPSNASLRWPLLPHNPYRKDGHAEPEEGRVSITLPLGTSHPKQLIRLEVQ
jgi:hypothetical protein